jgi:hypothetical protein
LFGFSKAHEWEFPWFDIPSLVNITLSVNKIQGTDLIILNDPVRISYAQGNLQAEGIKQPAGEKGNSDS